jgi:N-acyl-D-aspartate/D-glutamate deacylase
MCSVAPIVHNGTNTLWSDSLALLEEEAGRGAKLFGQSMPRTFDVNIRLSEASFILYALPAWSEIMRLPLPERLAAFRDPARREELRNQAVLLGPAWPHLIVQRVRDAANRALEGRRVEDVAAERGVSPADALLDLSCSEDLATEFCLKGMIQAETDPVTQILSHPRVHIGASDAGAHIAQFCGAGDTSYLLARWVRELRAFTLEHAVHRLTGELADAFGIRNRGKIRPGLAADLVVFDPDTIDRGAEDFVHDVPGNANRYVRHATGIDAVVVNGAVTWEDGGYTAARAGEIV